MYFNFQNEDALTLRFSIARAGRIVGRRRWPGERVAGGKDLELARAGKIVGLRRRPRERVAGEVWVGGGGGYSAPRFYTGYFVKK